MLYKNGVLWKRLDFAVKRAAERRTLGQRSIKVKTLPDMLVPVGTRGGAESVLRSEWNGYGEQAKAVAGRTGAAATSHITASPLSDACYKSGFAISYAIS